MELTDKEYEQIESINSIVQEEVNKLVLHYKLKLIN